MKTNIALILKELKDQLTSGWSSHERTHFKDWLEEEIKPYYPNLYLFLSGDFETELREKISGYRETERLKIEILGETNS